MKFSIPSLLSGGLIVNYACSSKCGHCHYNSSPQREKDYITVETAQKIFSFLKRNGCNSIHIGGFSCSIHKMLIDNLLYND